MKKMLSTATLALLAGAMMLPPSTAEARRWYTSRTAYAGYGFVGGLAVGNLLWDQPRHHRPVHHRPVYHAHRPVCHTQTVVHQPVVYHQPAPYYGDGTYTYRERRVWPFYRAVDAEYIPALPQAPYGSRPAAVSYAEMRAQQEQSRPITINIYNSDGTKSTVEAEANSNGEVSVNGNRSDIQDIRYTSNSTPSADATPRRTVAVSNRAGAQTMVEPAREESRSTEQPVYVSNDTAKQPKQSTPVDRRERRADVIMASNPSTGERVAVRAARWNQDSE